MDARVPTRYLPDPDLTVLVTGEDLFPSDYDGFNQTAVGFESGEFLLVLPDADVFAVGAGVEEVAGGGEGVNVAFLADEGSHEDVREEGIGSVVGGGGRIGVEMGRPWGFGERGSGNGFEEGWVWVGIGVH